MVKKLCPVLSPNGYTYPQSDGQTFCHGIVRAMRTRRAVIKPGCGMCVSNLKCLACFYVCVIFCTVFIVVWILS